MGNIINFPINNEEDQVIEVDSTEEFNDLVNEMSDFICKLPLNNTENNQLIELINNLLIAAKKDSFEEGLRMGTEAALY